MAEKKSLSELVYGLTAETNVPKSESKKPEFGNQWAAVSDNMFVISNTNYPRLQAGFYEFSIAGQQLAFYKKEVKFDELLDFKDSTADKVLKEIEFFWNQKEVFKKYGFLHRRGLMFIGKPGSGKSCLVYQICKKIIERDGIVFMISNPSRIKTYLPVFRHIEPHRNIICVFEDIDSIIANNGDEDLLQFLDGEDQTDNVLSLATTNYPERLAPRIINRPRRFDRVIEIGMPKAHMRKEYFKHKLNIENEELDDWVKNTKGFSFASMAELVISVKCMGHELNESIAKIKEHMKQNLSSDSFEDDDDNDKTIGFRLQ